IFSISTENIEFLYEYIKISKLYCAIHEIIHCIYKKDTERMNKELKRFNSLLDMIESFIKPNSTKVNSLYYKDGISKDDILKELQLCKSNDGIKLELLCDTYAFDHCICTFKQVWKDKYSELEIIDKCTEAIAVLKFYNQTLITVENNMKMILDAFNAGSDNKKIKDIVNQGINKMNSGTITRYYIEEMISNIELFKLLDNKENALRLLKNPILNNISDTYIIEGNLKKEFLSVESALEVIEKIQEVSNEDDDELIEKCNKFINM
ncbi:hypothetical protein, partial [Clostridium butyricum]